jgi:hypothetical protein
MPTLLTQISPLGSGIIVNPVIEDCCAPIFITWRNDHSSSLTLTNLTVTDQITPNYFTFQVQEINGIPAPGCWPFTIAAGATFIVKVEVCSVDNMTMGHSCEFRWDIIGHPDDVHQFGLGPYSPGGNSAALCCPNAFPDGVDFGSVEIGDSATLPFDMCNFTVQTLDINITWSGTGGGDVTFDLPVFQTLNPGDSFSGIFTWTPTSIYSLSVKATGAIDNCGSENCNDTLIGESIAGCDCLCCTDVSIGDYLGSPLNVQNGFCDSIDIYTSSAICEEKTIEFNLRYDPGMTPGAFQLFFNPWMFANFCDFASKYTGGQINAQPPTAFFFDYIGSMSPGNIYPMSLIGAGSNFFNQLNYSCDIEIVAADEMIIKFQFYMIEDIEDWLNNTMINNQPKWRRNDIFAVNPNEGDPILDNSMPSVYNMPKKLCSLFYTIDNFNLIDDQPRECYLTNSISWTARYYNKGLYNGASEFTNPIFSFIRNSQNVTTLSIQDETTAQFQINIPSGFGTLGAVWFQLFQETDINNNVDFLTNYDSSRSIIVTNPVPGVLNNHLQTPSSVTNAGTVWTISAQIGTTIDLSKTYRLAAIVYASDGVTVNTFVSDALTVTDVPTWDCDGCKISPVLSTFANYFQAIETNCFQPVSKERIRHVFMVNYADFKDCLSEFAIINEWRYFLKSITLNVYRRETNFPNSGESTLFIWQSHTSNRIIGFPGNWQNLGSMIVSDSLDTVQISYITNVLWENSPFNGSQVLTCNDATYMNRTNVGPLGATYATTLGVTNNWRGETIYLEYIFNFDLQSIVSTAFNLKQIMAFKMLPIGNEPTNTGSFGNNASVIQNMTIECQDSNGNWSFITNGQLCPENCENVRIIYSANQNGNFIFFANPVGGGVPQLIEYDPVISPNGIPGSAFPDMSTNYDYNFLTQAQITFSMSGWPSGQYEICGYWSGPPAINQCREFRRFEVKQVTANIIAPQYQLDNYFNFKTVNTVSGNEILFYCDDPLFGAIQGTVTLELTPLTPMPQLLTFYVGQNTLSGVGPVWNVPAGTNSTVSTTIFWSGLPGFILITCGPPTSITTTEFQLRVLTGDCN